MSVFEAYIRPTNNPDDQLVGFLVNLVQYVSRNILNIILTYTANQWIVHHIDVCQELAIIKQSTSHDAFGMFSNVVWVELSGFQTQG